MVRDPEGVNVSKSKQKLRPDNLNFGSASQCRNVRGWEFIHQLEKTVWFLKKNGLHKATLLKNFDRTPLKKAHVTSNIVKFLPHPIVWKLHFQYHTLIIISHLKLNSICAFQNTNSASIIFLDFIPHPFSNDIPLFWINIIRNLTHHWFLMMVSSLEDET